MEKYVDESVRANDWKNADKSETSQLVFRGGLALQPVRPACDTNDMVVVCNAPMRRIRPEYARRQCEYLDSENVP